MGVANMRVCFMNGSMIEHDGLGITYFSVDILKDMVACWYAWVSKLLCQNYTITLNHIKVQLSMQRKEYDMTWWTSLHIKNSVFTQGRVGVKLGDADTSPTYL